MNNAIRSDRPEVFVPISLAPGLEHAERITAEILYQHREYGFDAFLLIGPTKGWRGTGYPPEQEFDRLARTFAAVRDAVAPYGIRCGWWNILTVKSGPSPAFDRMVRADGSVSPFANCPMDPAFRARLAADTARFAAIAEPEYLFLEDDYSIAAGSGHLGCFCRHHLAEFSARENREFTRETLVEALNRDDALLTRWRALMRDSLVLLADEIRRELDSKAPGIPVGLAQSGASFWDGDACQRIADALAGTDCVPFVRTAGIDYCATRTGRALPEMMYPALSTMQRGRDHGAFIYEADAFPHTRFFSSAMRMKAILGAAYAMGFDGAVFQTRQEQDDPDEDPAYGRMYASERKRFDEVFRTARVSRLRGVSLPFAPASFTTSLWAKCIGLFGIPMTTEDADIAFWDAPQATYADDAAILRQLGRGLFLDGSAAKVLCGRGYGRYLGVEVGEDVFTGARWCDLGASEVICPAFASPGHGREMPAAHIYACGNNGIQRELRIADSRCEPVTECSLFDGTRLCPGMTRFENELGGRVVVMGMTLENNDSQSLLNYRRQRLIQQLMVWCADKNLFVTEAPDVFTLVREAENPEKDGFRAMAALILLGEDTQSAVTLHLSETYADVRQVLALDAAGQWDPLPYTIKDGSLRMDTELRYYEPLYLRLI